MSGEHPSPVDTTPASPVAAARFDVRDFARTAVGSHRESIDLSVFEEDPLPLTVVQLLAYARELERSTMTYLRNVLVTPTHKDARVTAFLTTWAFEKYWIADSFEVVVRAHGVDPAEAETLSRFRAIALEIAERATPIVESFRANAIGTDVIGLHMASVAVDEWITEAAYTRLLADCPHAVLTPLLEHVLEVKARHRLFVDPDAERRLAESPRARSLARRALPRIDWPIGAASLARTDTALFYEQLIDDELARSIDAKAAELPGLEKLHLVQNARRAALENPGHPAARLGRSLGAAAATLAHTLRSTTKGGTNG
ncbi:hypothetical protein N1028_11020 [Herbiconiux sp. CPCC 203407]|uniref:Uncharacterized protein n=1 Tax=Herbiconiux oxytropis TaxID=2970915 RepID=A0AA41XIC4_9MICO|nr:hypothetical protein [Herbiconiux oxytropis]MCS5723504.1 hypothetical protein [Herbiconiux oxytropis]MCS5726423.1 hypothetical protein [Herbiconiux oxytropis]